jgi:hypothetical protein
MDTNLIRGERRTGFGVAPDGESVAIHLMDAASRPATLLLPAECLNALIMTLPEILRRTLHLATLGSLAVYASQRRHRQLIEVLATSGGWGIPWRDRGDAEA